MEEVTARVCLVSISRSRYSAVYVGGHAKTALLHAAISAAAHQMCEMLMNVQLRSCRDERSELGALLANEARILILDGLAAHGYGIAFLLKLLC